MDALLQALMMLATATAADASIQTTNFTVTAPTREIAEQVGEAAEFYRRDLAQKWLGEELKPWYRRCPVQVRIGSMGAGGATSFSFDRGHVFGWRMNVNGSLERVLDSVLPHEVSHTIFASHFRRPLPRWADEGAASLVEHDSERMRLQTIAEQALRNGRRIPLRQLLDIKEYPADMQDTLTLYAEGYLLSDFLVQRGGRERFLEFIEFAHRNGWEPAFERFYRINELATFESKWHSWIVAGSPRFGNNGQELAANDTAPGAEPELLVRAQTPDEQATRDSSRTRPMSMPQSQPPRPTVVADVAVGASRVLDQPTLRLPDPAASPAEGANVWDAWNKGWQPTNRIRRQLAVGKQ